MGRTSSYCKQTLVALLVYVLALTPTLVFAAGKNYNVKTIYYDPLEKVINATILDQIAEKTMQKSAKVPVTASATGSTVASMIRMGLAGAVIYGIVQGAGWIIKNGIVYKPGGGSNPIPPDQKYYYTLTLDSENSWQSTSASELYGKYVNAWNKSPNGWGKITGLRSSITDENFNVVYDPIYENFPNWVAKVVVQRVTNPDYDPDVDPTDSMLPVDQDELGEKVNSSPEAPQVLPDIYNPNNPAGGKAPQSTSDALDNANPVPETAPTGETKPKPNKDTDGDGVPDVHDPTLPSQGDEFTLPEFCSWAVTMCEWYKKYKEDSKQAEAQRQSEQVAWQREEIARQQEESQREKERNFWQKVEDWFNKWDDTPEQNDDTEVDIDQPENQNIDTTINFGGACPQPISVPYSFAGASGTIEFSYEPLCQIASFIKPVVITVASFSAALIIGGIRTEDD